MKRQPNVSEPNKRQSRKCFIEYGKEKSEALLKFLYDHTIAQRCRFDISESSKEKVCFPCRVSKIPILMERHDASIAAFFTHISKRNQCHHLARLITYSKPKRPSEAPHASLRECAGCAEDC